MRARDWEYSKRKLNAIIWLWFARAAFGITESEWASIAGAVTAMASVVSFIIGEAKIDAAGAEGASIKGLIDEAEAKAGADEKDAEKEEGGV